MNKMEYMISQVSPVIIFYNFMIFWRFDSLKMVGRGENKKKKERRVQKRILVN